MEEQEFLNELAELKENVRMLTEDRGYVAYPIVMSDKDIYVNYNDWLQSKSHVLIVTGIPGSGKSTLAKKLAQQFNVHYVELDVITFKIANPAKINQHDWDYVKEQDIMLYKYLQEKKLEPDFLAKQVTRHLPPEPIQFKETMLYMDWLINNQIERCVIDGSCAAMFFEDRPEWQTLPIIFKGTSVLKAIFRRLKRNTTKHGLFEGIALFVSRVVTSIYDQYSSFTKEQNIGRRVVLPNQDYEWVSENYQMQFIFYHGSQEKYPELLPVSPNMGNRWEPPKWVTYMWKEKENAIRWGMQRAIAARRRELGLLGKEGATITWGEGPYTKLGALASEKNIIKKIGIGAPFYVYTIQIKPNTLGVGHATGLDEYTSTDPKPKILKLEKKIITEKLIEDYVDFLTPEEWKKYTKVSLSATRGDLAGLMYDQEETFKREMFIKIRQRVGLLKPGDNLQVCVDQYLEDKEKYNKLFSKFKSLRQLVSYIKSNVQGVSKKDDQGFIWPDEVLTKKKGSCWDIALLIWHYCTFTSTYTNKISTRICRVGFSYRHAKDSSLSHQYHVVCMIKEDDKWKVINFSANNAHPDLKDPIYTCRYNHHDEVLKSFASKYIPILYKLLQQEHSDAIMEKRITQVASNRTLQEFWVINNGKTLKGQKQKLISELFEDT